MKKLILHIGRHKTGSSAIQDCLIKNTALLKDYDYYYPREARKGRGHHQIAESNAGLLKRLNSLLIRPKLPEAVIDELLQNDQFTPILSSEAFQNCHPHLIKQLFENYDINVVIYLRNHIDYLASAYTQWVHSSDYKGSIWRYFFTSYSVNYRRFLQQWERQFPGKLVVRRFEPTALVNNDIRTDFLTYGLNIDTTKLPKFAHSTTNPSLNQKVLQLKLHLNRIGETKKYCPHRLYKALPLLNKEFPARQFQTPRLIAKWVRQRNRNRDSEVAQEYFSEKELFHYKSEAPVHSYNLSKTELSHMKEALSELINEQ
uniref:hypothetical protein n=1 Tax=Microbulbifer agarilyticus TaxID=260552 RepID=UPI000255B7AC|nr:hypothetical protein [Microbulbifer agarilyticus]